MRMTTKFGFAIALAAAVAFVAAPTAQAGVVSSNHDLSFKTAGSLKSGACSHCHIPHKAGGDRLWASTYSDSAGTAWTSEVISQLCYTCHGNGVPAIAMQQNPFGGLGSNVHGRTVTTLTGWGDIGSVPTDVPLSGADLKCTSCHDVHNNQRRPFLRWVTSAGFNFNENCAKCHPNRENSGLRGTDNVVNGFSQHPVQITLPSNAANSVNRAYFVVAQPEFAIVPGTQVEGVAGAAAWNMGGHRNNAVATGQMGCVTCHAVHGDEENNFSAANGAVQTASPQLGFNHITVREADPLNGAAAPYVAPLCTGCHRNDANAGPGRLNSYTHRIEIPRVGLVFQVNADQGYKWGNANADLVCQSCHKIHYGQPNTSLLYGTIEAPVATSNRNCPQCHDFTAPHHPNGPATSVPAAMLTSTRSSAAMNWTTLTRTASGAFAWGTGNTLLCSTCHWQVGAHNNSGVFNATVGYNVNSEMCVDCHTTNPSTHTTVSAGVPGSSTVTLDASHYIGNIATVGYKRTVAWGTTGLSSRYATTGTGLGADGAVICQSCHTVSFGGTLPGPTYSQNVVPPVAGRLRASIGLLLEVAGNSNNVFNADITGVAADLCTGCHGASPQGGTATGSTGLHPAISAGMVGITDTALQTKLIAEFNARGSVSLNSASLVNCESCHRPHDAAGGAGALILEGVGTASNKLAGGANNVQFDRATGNGGLRYAEEATFCNLCHSY